MEINYKKIGSRIRKERIKQKITQQYLAEISNLSTTNISHIERGATKLSLPSLIAIVNALNTTADRFLMDTVNNSDILFRAEFAELLSSCSKDEYRILINICKVIIENLRGK
jgi:transcriptional regulator with XRE-family HTH domain